MGFLGESCSVKTVSPVPAQSLGGLPKGKMGMSRRRSERMRSRLLLKCVLTLAASLAISQAKNDGESFVIRGRIVVYDWYLHEQTAWEDFVVKLQDPGADLNQLYIRAIYRPIWGFDAPSPSPRDVLNRRAFVGRGPKWKIRVHPPKGSEERAACGEIQLLIPNLATSPAAENSLATSKRQAESPRACHRWAHCGASS